MASIASARYGKDNVRVYKVERDDETGIQTVTEMTVSILLEGAIDASYTEADNSVVVATDTMKNTIYIKAKECPVRPPELFASILGTHFIQTYGHISVAHVKVITHRWSRMTIDGKPHPHSFHRDGSETRNVDATISRTQGIRIRSGIKGLLLLKSTGSQFHGFIRDEYTTLPEVWDRVLSTEVDCVWTWNNFSGLQPVQEFVFKFDAAWEDARSVTMKTFAEENSPSVQNIMYKMSLSILEKVLEVESVDYSLPNRHYFEADLSWHKRIKNTGRDAEVYVPQNGPNGLIQLTVSRSTASQASARQH